MSSLFDEDNEGGSLFAKVNKKETSVPAAKAVEEKPAPKSFPDGNLLLLPILLSCVDPRTSQYVKVGQCTVLFKREKSVIFAIIILPNKSVAKITCDSSISWTLQNYVYCVVVSPQGSTFLLQFRNQNEAFFATSVALFEKTQKENIVNITAPSENDNPNLKIDLFVFELNQPQITSPLETLSGIQRESKEYLSAIKLSPRSQYLVKVDTSKIAFVIVKDEIQQVPETPEKQEEHKTEANNGDKTEAQKVDENDEYEYEYEEEDVAEDLEKISLADILNEADKKFDSLFRSILMVKPPKTYDTAILSQDQVIARLEKELRKSEEKDMKMSELDSRIKYLSKFSKNKQDDSSERISYKTEELVAADAMFDSACSDLAFEQEVFDNLSAKVGQHDKEVQNKIDKMREQSKKEFEISNKQLTDEIKELQEKIKMHENEKIECQNKAIQFAREAALIKAGGSDEAEKLKGEITEKLKSIVQTMVTDVFDAVSSSFDESESYVGSKVVNAIKIALQNAADDIINPDEYDEEEDEE